MGVQVGDGLPRTAASAERTELQLAVPEEQPEQLTPGVPARAGDRRPHAHAAIIHTAAWLCTQVPRSTAPWACEAAATAASRAARTSTSVRVRSRARKRSA